MHSASDPHGALVMDFEESPATSFPDKGKKKAGAREIPAFRGSSATSEPWP